MTIYFLNLWCIDSMYNAYKHVFLMVVNLLHALTHLFLELSGWKLIYCGEIGLQTLSSRQSHHEREYRLCNIYTSELFKPFCRKVSIGKISIGQFVDYKISQDYLRVELNDAKNLEKNMILRIRDLKNSESLIRKMSWIAL